MTTIIVGANISATCLASFWVLEGFALEVLDFVALRQSCKEGTNH
jgi:hypothetical protein